MSETMDQPVVTSRKSVTCRYFAASGTCFYGEECQFLHTTIKPSRISHYGVSNVSSTSTIHSKDFALEEASVNRNNVSENYFGGGAIEDVDNFKERSNVTYPHFDESAISSNVFPPFKEGASGATYFFPPKDQLQSQTLMNNLEDGKFPGRSEKSALPVGTTTRLQSEGRSALMADVNDAFSKLSVESYNGHKAPASYFMPEDLRSDIIYRNALTVSTVDPSSYPGLPQEVDHYNELVPLEPYCLGRAVKSSSYGLITSTYKATHTKTGLRYCLKRIHGYKLSNPRCLALVDLWKKLKHCHVVTLCEVFTTKAFGDNSMIFAYEYYPGAETLLDKYFSPSSSSSERHGTDLSVPRPYSSQKSSLSLHSGSRGMIAESTLWSYIIQMCSALRAVHAAGLAFRRIDASKVLVSSGNRIRLNGGGIMDVLGFDTQMVSNSSMMAHFQQEDLLSLGKLLLSLGCNSMISLQRDNLTSSVEYISKHFSNDFRNLIIYLLTSNPGSRLKSIQEVMPIIGARFFGQLESVVQYSDTLEDYLSRELDNGRLFRLLAKLGSVVDRPELNMDSNWSETGDRYLLKLFQDYVLHPSSDDGRPWVDLAHIVSCMNRLDTASQDKICLTSRDHQNVLVVSYAELHQCLEASFAELQQAAAGAIPVTNPVPDSGV